MRRLSGVLMVAIAAFFLVAAILAVVEQPEQRKIIQEAPFISDGVLDPENEGKTVILEFDISDMGDAYDRDLGFTFPYPCVTREVEQLKCTLANRKWEWVKVKDSDETFGSRAFFGDASVGDYQIEGNLLRSLALYKDLYESDFDAHELANFFEYFDTFSSVYWNDRLYLTNTSGGYFEDFDYEDGKYSSTRAQYEKETGSVRIRYRGLPRERYGKIAVIGKQQGNWIVEDDRVDGLTAWENVEDAKALSNKSTLSVIGGILLAAIPCGFLVIFGVRRIFDEY